MARTAQAKRYAQAVFQIAQQDGDFERWSSDLQTLATLGHSDIFVKALETPKLTVADQTRLLADRFPRVGPLALNLISLLLQRRRVILLPTIYDEYQRLLDSHRGIERAQVITAVPMDDEDRRRVEQRLEALSGKKITVSASVDPSIVGGVVARFGGKLLDGSTRSRLEALKKEIGRIPR